MTKEEYLQLMSEEYFRVCSGSSVIEIGPNTAIHTDLIIKHNPDYLKLIESDQQCANRLSKITRIDEIIAEDVIQVLHNKHRADVVICCGVLYHLHNPLHLLELITNNCNPKYVILDCVIDQNHLQFLPEVDNIPGNRNISTHWKSAKFNFVIPFNIVDISMQNMGYKLIKTHLINVVDYLPKSDSWIAMWEKQ